MATEQVQEEQVASHEPGRAGAPPPAAPDATGTSPTALFVCGSLDEVDPARFAAEVFICGGAELYRQALPRCSDLYLTLVKRHVDGDAFFPEFEDRFELAATVRQTPEFNILHYRNRDLVRQDTTSP